MKKILSLLLLTTITLFILPLHTEASVMLPAGKDPDPKVVQAALAEFKSLSKKEKKLRIKEAKKQAKLFKKNNKNAHPSSVSMVVLIILAILLPPLGIYLHDEEINWKFWVSFPLWFLFIIPGVIFALLVVTDVIE
jgi:uncharacterized membrane protein YqaE (UPF0057 family)